VAAVSYEDLSVAAEKNCHQYWSSNWETSFVIHSILSSSMCEIREWRLWGDHVVWLFLSYGVLSISAEKDLRLN